MRSHEEVPKPKPKGARKVDDVIEPPGPPNKRPDVIEPPVEQKDPLAPKKMK